MSSNDQAGEEGYNPPSENKWAKSSAFGVAGHVRQKTGKFSREESEIVRKAVEDFCAMKQISVSRLCSECDHKAELKGR